MAGCSSQAPEAASSQSHKIQITYLVPDMSICGMMVITYVFISF